jgi:hypothetical protein
VDRVTASAIRILFGLPVAPLQLTCLYRARALHQIWIEYGDSPFIVPEILIKGRDVGARVIEIATDSARPLPVRSVVSHTLYDAAHFKLRRLTERKEET